MITIHSPNPSFSGWRCQDMVWFENGVATLPDGHAVPAEALEDLRARGYVITGDSQPQKRSTRSRSKGK